MGWVCAHYEFDEFNLIFVIFAKHWLLDVVCLQYYLYGGIMDGMRGLIPKLQYDFPCVIN